MRPPHFNRLVGALADLKGNRRKRERNFVPGPIPPPRPIRTAKLSVRTGMPAHEIVQAAKELDVDLIVIATNGLTGWKHFCIGSTAEQCRPRGALFRFGRARKGASFFC